MNDSKTEIGSNWGTGTPRTMREAFPHSPGASIGGEFQAIQEQERQQRRDALFTIAVLALVFIAGCVIGPFVMSDPSSWCWM